MLCPSCGSPEHIMVPPGRLCVLTWKATAYAQGRADERAAVVAWLRGRGYVSAAETSRQIDRGEHVDAGKVKP